MRLPQQEYQRQYGYAPLFNILPLDPVKQYRHANMFNLSHRWEYEQWSRSRSWNLLMDRPRQWYTALKVLLGGVILLFPLVAFAPRTMRDRRMRLPWICLIVAIAGAFLEVIYYAHYAAPVTIALILLVTQGLRHLRVGRGEIGIMLARAAPVAVIVFAVGSQAARIYRQETPEQNRPVNARRDKLEETLRSENGGRHLILARYAGQ